MRKDKSFIWEVAALASVEGTPVTEDFAQRIGADRYAADASRAVALSKSLISPSE